MDYILGKKRHCLEFDVYRKKKRGILKIDKKTKDIEWISSEENNRNKIVILGKNFIDVITKSKDEENREVINIIDKINNYNIFSVYGENRKNIAMTISQVLKTTYEVFFEEQFKKLSNVNKKRIILLLKDNYLKKLFNKISNKNNRNQIEILKVDDFWNFIRKKYPNKLLFSLIENKIQSARLDELELKISPIKFNNYIKKRIIDNYSGVKIIFENYININQSEETFWVNFLKNQFNAGSEIIGGMEQIYFTEEEKKNIEKKENEKIKINRSKHLCNISNVFENVEYHMNYVDPYERNCLLLLEKDYSVTYDDIIQSNENKINDYSIRKLDEINFIPKTHICRIYEESNKKFSSEFIDKKNKKNNIDNNDIVIINSYEVKPKINNILEKLENMEKNQKKLSEKSFNMTFKRINEQLRINAEKKDCLPIKENELSHYEKISNETNLYRDLRNLYEIIKDKTNKDKKTELEHLISSTKKKLERSKNFNSICNSIKNYFGRVYY